jgi:hypothetical protein
VLERLRLPAFDLCKAVEPFVLQLPGVPRCAAWLPRRPLRMLPLLLLLLLLLSCCVAAAG